MAKRPLKPPPFVEPSKPKRFPRPPSGERWLHEVKFDGHRVHVRIDGGELKILSSRGNDYTPKAGQSVAHALRSLPARSAYLDAEMVVNDEDGVSDFGLLQKDLASRRTDRILLYFFDLLFLDGVNLMAKPLVERKAALAALLSSQDERSPLKLSAVFEESDGQLLYEHACRLGVEGVVSKIRDSRYLPGDAGFKVWHKAICNHVSQFVVCGYVPSTTGDVAELYIGAREGMNVFYRGHLAVGGKASRGLKPLLSRAEQTRNPYADKPTKLLSKRRVRFVKPSRLVDVTYRGITSNGRLRHPSFVGLTKPSRQA